MIKRKYKMLLTDADNIKLIDLADNASHSTLLNPTEILNLKNDIKIYCFYAQMGAGKTTFIKSLCQSLGVEDIVNSPTFAIVNVYSNTAGDEIYHFDCYRLKNKEEALEIGTEEYIYSSNYCFIEWPEVIEDILPNNIANIYITQNGEERTLEIIINE